MPKIIEAQFDSECEYCGDDIHEDDPIAHTDGYGWVHADPDDPDSCYPSAVRG